MSHPTQPVQANTSWSELIEKLSLETKILLTDRRDQKWHQVIVKEELSNEQKRPKQPRKRKRGTVE